MRPITCANFDGGFINEQPKKMINGPRPSPLLINKGSHLIQKKQQRQPIIIYTQSPKIIHTKAQDFMALVQRLTGMSKSNNDRAVSTVTENFESSFSDATNSNNVKQEEDKLQEMNLLGANCDYYDETSSHLRRDSEKETLDFADMPLFTPTPTSDFFRSLSRSVYKYSDDSPFGILGSLISPSGLEFLRELPEY